MKDSDLPAVLGEGLRHSLRIHLYIFDELYLVLMCKQRTRIEKFKFGLMNNCTQDE
jgi:hypothetical protein